MPVYNTVREAVEAQGVNTSIIFVPPRFAADAALEAIDAGIGLVVCITEWIPIHEMMEVTAYAAGQGDAAHRSQLSRPHLAGRIPRRHPAGRDLSSRTRRTRLPQRHVDV